MQRGEVEAWSLCQMVKQGFAVRLFAQEVHQDGEKPLGFAHDDDVDKRPDWHRVGKRQRSAHHDQGERPRMRRTLGSKRGDSGKIQAGHQAGQFQLGRQRKPDHGKVAHGPA